MRPQGFKYSIGNTLLADESMVANITLLRSPDMATFDDEEVRAFESLSRHLTRSLRISVRLERAEASSNSIGALDGLPLAVALVDAKLQLLYANGAMESLLRTRRGLALSQGALHASSEGQRRLLACVSNALASIAEEVCPAPPLVLRFQQGTQLTLHAVPVTGSRWRYVPSKPVVLLMASNPGDERCGSCDALRETYDFTRSESRLAQLLTRGSELRRAAKEMGITYGTARGYLKVMFEKVGVHSQAQLVSRLLRLAPARSPSRRSRWPRIGRPRR